MAGSAGFRTEEAYEICRIGLQNYFAGALILPYQPFSKAARDLRHDVELLAARFGASLEQVCHRLSTLQRPGQKGIPIFFARIDRAGNITKRHQCRQVQFAASAQPARSGTASGLRDTGPHSSASLRRRRTACGYLCLATQITKGRRRLPAAHPRYALALGCEISYADASFMPTTWISGTARLRSDRISCRICERTRCASRAVPPLKRKLIVDNTCGGALPYRLSET